MYVQILYKATFKRLSLLNQSVYIAFYSVKALGSADVKMVCEILAQEEKEEANLKKQLEKKLIVNKVKSFAGAKMISTQSTIECYLLYQTYIIMCS